MNLQGKRAAIVTLGCKVNQYETDAMYGMLKEAGVTMVDPKEAADIYIVNTCSVTNMAERKSRQMLHRAKKKNPDVVVVAVGCYAQVGKEELSKDTNIDLIIGNNKKKDLIHILEEHMGEKESAAESIEVIDIAHDQEYESLHVEQLKEHTRAYIKVQDGCNQFCSYCIIPYARGPIRSLPLNEAISQTRALAAAGYQEIVLTGIEISSWGQDLKKRRDPDRPTGGCLHRRTGCPHPAGEPGAPDHHRGVLPPGGRPAEPLPPVPLVYAVRMRRHPEANEPEIRYHSICAVRCTFKSIF